jgi:hypothetical protein
MMATTVTRKELMLQAIKDLLAAATLATLILAAAATGGWLSG